MDAIEKAIRNAFEKGNAEDRSFREKVYRSAFAALDRALQANSGVTVETAINRRKAMQAKIAEIESEYLPAIVTAHQAAPQVPQVTDPDDEPAPAVDVRARSDQASVPMIDMPERQHAAGPAPNFEGPSVSPAVREAAPGSPHETVEPPLASALANDTPRGGVMPVVPDIMPERPLPGSAP